MSAKKKNNLNSISTILTRRVDNLAQFFAWVGTLLILAGYFFTTVGVMSQSDPIYHGLNLLGAVGIISITLPKKVYQSVFLNAFWAITAIVGIIKFITRN
jgi:hypothetical protein